MKRPIKKLILKSRTRPVQLEVRFHEPVNQDATEIYIVRYTNDLPEYMSERGWKKISPGGYYEPVAVIPSADVEVKRT